MGQKKKHTNQLAVLQERYRQGAGKAKAEERAALKYMTYWERKQFKALGK